MINPPNTFYVKHGKRMLDLALVSVVFLLFWWVFLGVFFAVRIKLGSPVLFNQERPGCRGEIFHLFKFRTMTDERDCDGNLLPDIQRLTPFGRFLRNSSLDELPELFNVLKGEMSLVGPRPLLVKYLPLYSERQMHRHDVLPGLTGLAQTNGRNSSTWEQRFEYDLYYVEHLSLALDLKIMVDTVKKVVRKDDIDSGSTSKYTMMEFTGAKDDK